MRLHLPVGIADADLKTIGRRMPITYIVSLTDILVGCQLLVMRWWFSGKQSGASGLFDILSSRGVNLIERTSFFVCDDNRFRGFVSI